MLFIRVPRVTTSIYLWARLSYVSFGGKRLGLLFLSIIYNSLFVAFGMIR